MAIDYNLLKSYIGDDPLYNLYEQGWQGLLDPGNIKSFSEDPLREGETKRDLATSESFLHGYTYPKIDTSLYLAYLDQFGNKPVGPLYGKSIMDESFLDSESWKQIQTKPGGEKRYLTKREDITNALKHPDPWQREHALSDIFGFYTSAEDVAMMPEIYKEQGYEGGTQPTITERNKIIGETIGHEARHQLLQTPEFTEKYVNTLPSGEFDFYGQKRDFPGYYDKHESLNRMLDFQAYNDPNIYQGIYDDMGMPRNLTNMYTDALSENATKFTNDILDQEAAQIRRFLHYNYPESAAWKSYNKPESINIEKIPHQGSEGITTVARLQPNAQSFRSAPGGLTQAQSRAARGDPKGTGGGWKWADGGLATMFERR
jgi:hypothetical protein